MKVPKCPTKPATNQQVKVSVGAGVPFIQAVSNVMPKPAGNQQEKSLKETGSQSQCIQLGKKKHTGYLKIK